MTEGTIEVGTGGISSRFIKTDWPIEEGLEGGTTKTSGRKFELEAEEGSNVPQKERVLL